MTLRAPEIKDGVTYAAYIHPSNAEQGAYGGMSFVIFPATDQRKCDRRRGGLD
jgi:5-methylcytosine-specific restriction protein B